MVSRNPCRAEVCRGGRESSRGSGATSRDGVIGIQQEPSLWADQPDAAGSFRRPQVQTGVADLDGCTVHRGGRPQQHRVGGVHAVGSPRHLLPQRVAAGSPSRQPQPVVSSRPDTAAQPMARGRRGPPPAPAASSPRSRREARRRWRPPPALRPPRCPRSPRRRGCRRATRARRRSLRSRPGCRSRGRRSTPPPRRCSWVWIAANRSSTGSSGFWPRSSNAWNWPGSTGPPSIVTTPSPTAISHPSTGR